VPNCKMTDPAGAQIPDLDALQADACGPTYTCDSSASQQSGSGGDDRCDFVAPSFARRRIGNCGGWPRGQRVSGRCQGALLKTQAPAFYRFNVGGIQATVVSDGVIVGVTKTTFVGPAATNVEKMMTDLFLPTDKFVMDQNALVINTGDKLALFETGMASVNRHGRRALNRHRGFGLTCRWYALHSRSVHAELNSDLPHTRPAPGLAEPPQFFPATRGPWGATEPFAVPEGPLAKCHHISAQNL
jgi:hypothetical protein